MFKFTGLIAVALLASFNGSAQQSAIAVVQGKVDNPYIKEMEMLRVVDGNTVHIASQRLSVGGAYAFALPDVPEGFYYLSDDQKVKNIKTRFYLKKGEQLELNIHEHGYDMKSSSEENILLDKWQQLASEITEPGLYFWTDHKGYADFFSRLTAFAPKMAALRKKSIQKIRHLIT